MNRLIKTHLLKFASNLSILSTFLLGYLFFAPFSWADSASFVPLGGLGGPYLSSEAFGISGNGSVVVGRSVSPLGNEAFRWTQDTGMLGLGLLTTCANSRAYGVSHDGSVIVGDCDDANWGSDKARPFRWTQANGMVDVGLLPDGQFYANALGVSGDGSTIVGYGDSQPNGTMAFRWTEADGMVALGFLREGDNTSCAYGVSGDGSAIVGDSYSALANTAEAFRWTPAIGMVGLGLLPGGSVSLAKAVSADGLVVVGGATTIKPQWNGWRGFRWTQSEGMMPLEHFNMALGVSSNGVVVGIGREGDWYGALIWDATRGTRLLKNVLENDYHINLTGWTLNDAVGISADGMTIVGTGVNPAGKTEAYLANLDPSVIARSIIAGVITTDVTGQTTPVANANIALLGTSFSTTTDNNGNFFLSDIPSGHYTLVVSSPNFVPIHQQVDCADGGFQIEPLSVKLKTYSPGDANGDGNLGVEDAIFILQNVSGMR